MVESQWIFKWLKQVLDEGKINQSISLKSTDLSRSDAIRRAHGDIVMKLFTADQKSFNINSVFFLYHWEAVVDHLRISLLLAFAGLYNPAFTLLRNSLELLLKGAFFDALAKPEFRNDWKLSMDYGVSKIRNDLVATFEADPKYQENVEQTSILILNSLESLLQDYDPSRDVRNIAQQLVWWNFFYPQQDQSAVRAINSLYTELSSSVHEYPEKTNFGRVMREGKEFEFEQTVLESALQEFLNMWNKLFDLATVLTINIRSHALGEEEAKSRLKDIPTNKNYQKADLPLAKNLLGAILSPN